MPINLVIYTNNQFLLSFVENLFNNSATIRQICNCQEFRSLINIPPKKNISVIVDSTEIKDDLCWTNMMSRIPFPVTVVAPNKRSTLQSLLMLEQSMSNIHYDHSNDKNPNGNSIILQENMIFDIGKHCIYHKEHIILLSSLEFRILYYLTRNLEQPVPVSDLIDYLETTESVLYIYINKIRNKIEKDPKNPKILLNLRGRGYIIKSS